MWDYPDPFVMDHTVVKTDTDRLGHTNNQVYLKWFEDISWQHIEPEGMSWSIQKDLGKSMAITRTEIDYLAASYETDHLQIGTWITHSDGRLFTSRRFQIIRPKDQKVIVRAKSNYACIDLVTGRPSRMPEAIKNTLARLSIEIEQNQVKS